MRSRASGILGASAGRACVIGLGRSGLAVTRLLLHSGWKVRALVRSFVNSPDEDPNLSFMLQLELASLGTFGSDIGSAQSE